MIRMKLCKTNDSLNVLNKSFSFNNEIMNINFKNPINIFEPSLTLHTNIDLKKYNYLYDLDNNMYYYFSNSDIVDIGKNLYTINLHVDVLESFKTDILNIQAICIRNEIKNDKYITDDKIPIKSFKSIVAKRFPNEIKNENFSYVLITA